MVLGLAAVMVLGVVGVAAAAPWGAGFGRGVAGSNPTACATVIGDLNLTDEQVSKIQEIQAAAFEKLRSIGDALFQKMFELRSLYWQKNPDQEAIAAKQSEVNELRQQMSEIRQQVHEQMTGVLTQEQLSKLGRARGFEPGRHGRGGWGGFRGAPVPGTGTTAPSGAGF